MPDDLRARYAVALRRLPIHDPTVADAEALLPHLPRDEAASLLTVRRGKLDLPRLAVRR